MNEEQIKELARKTAVHIITMCCDTEGFDCVRMDVTKELDATQEFVTDAIRAALKEVPQQERMAQKTLGIMERDLRDKIAMRDAKISGLVSRLTVAQDAFNSAIGLLRTEWAGQVRGDLINAFAKIDKV